MCRFTVPSSKDGGLQGTSLFPLLFSLTVPTLLPFLPSFLSAPPRRNACAPSAPSLPSSSSPPSSFFRYCVFPQEIVVKIDPPCRFRKLQLLSHQYLIASTVELYVGHNTSEGHTSLRHAEFTRLGYVSLSSNESTRYKVLVLFSASCIRYQGKRHCNSIRAHNCAIAAATWENRVMQLDQIQCPRICIHTGLECKEGALAHMQ